MHYMGINNIEDAIYYELDQFRKRHGPRRILKILVSPKAYKLVQSATLNRSGVKTPELLEALRTTPIYWNKILIEENSKVKRIIVVPKGSLAECIYV